MDVGRVEFVKSVGAEARYPEHDLPEVAFAGRSNSGKSTLVNTLVGRRQLARVSRTPGRTQLLNFFRVDDRLMLVDLPGYGYAAVPDAVRAAWGPMIERYLRDRVHLRALVLLLDARRDPAEHERRLCEWCAARGLPIVYVATKIDKLKASERTLRLRAMAAAYEIPVRDLVAFSGTTREGRDELWQRIARFCEDAEGSV